MILFLQKDAKQWFVNFQNKELNELCNILFFCVFLRTNIDQNHLKPKFPVNKIQKTPACSL